MIIETINDFLSELIGVSGDSLLIICLLGGILLTLIFWR